MWGHGLDLCDLVWRQVAGSCKRGNEPSGSVKCGEFLDCSAPGSFPRSTLLHGVRKYVRIPVAAQSKACVSGRLQAGIAGSNRARCINGCVF